MKHEIFKSPTTTELDDRALDGVTGGTVVGTKGPIVQTTSTVGPTGGGGGGTGGTSYPSADFEPNTVHFPK
jgi:hypothetical protein